MASMMTRLNLSIKDAYLELIQAEHLDKLYELFELNRDYLRRNIPGIDLIQTREDLQRRWANSNENSMQFGLWLNEKELIGRCRLTKYENSTYADVGYWLSEVHQGQGLMTSAVEELVKFAFEKCNVERIEIHCGINNLKSRSIPERLGFINEGISQTDQPVQLNGQMVQSIVYSKYKSTLNDQL
jgi:ribosomal-protein-serine acetyltransferase